jgi:glycosyl-4,4'-diaponeurosporenoate acyltransferase
MSNRRIYRKEGVFVRIRLFINSLLVLFVQSVISTIVFLGVPEKYLDHTRWLFKEKSWENGGSVYQKIFKVRKWKDKLPELSDFFHTTFSKRDITGYDPDYLEKYILESCRAEMSHWSIIILAFWSVVCNDYVISMLIVATALNLPFIIIQRYNRPRILHLLNAVEAHRDYVTSEVAEHSENAVC